MIVFVVFLIYKQFQQIKKVILPVLEYWFCHIIYQTFLITVYQILFVVVPIKKTCFDIFLK